MQILKFGKLLVNIHFKNKNFIKKYLINLFYHTTLLINLVILNKDICYKVYTIVKKTVLLNLIEI